jgi:hypothetical protein
VELSEQTSTDTTITESKQSYQKHLEQNPKNQLCILMSLALHSEEDIECMTTTTTTTTTTYIA